MITTRRHNLTQIPWQAVVAAAALLPTVGVLAARSVLPSSGPRAASAAPSVDNESGTTSIRSNSAGQLSAQDVSFLETIASNRSSPITKSPIAQKAGRNVRIDDQPQSTSKSFTDEPALRSTESSVTSILKSNGQMIAMIGGKLRRVGDRLSDGWSVKNIDADEGTVLLVHVSGYTKSLSLRKKQ
ncbi:MAG: hypothetical protein U0640_09890 [Phycisphaerales bacterium]